MKKIKILLGIAALSAALFACNKEELVEKIPNSEIPDMLFRDYLLLHFDTDMDGFISKKEAEAVKEIDISNVRINSLTGIHFFTSLEKLIVHVSSIESLDLTSNSKLEVLDCSDNADLISLVLPDSKRLKSLNCSYTRIGSISLNGFEFLEEFSFSQKYRGHTVEKLEINNSSLKRFIFDNGVRILNINNLPNLEFLSIRNANDINGNHTVDLSKSTKLKFLSCEYLNCEINTSQCPSLEELILNLIIAKPLKLDISNNKTLHTLRIGSSNISLSSFKNNTGLKNFTFFALEDEPIDFSNNTLLEKLSVTGGGNINLSQCKNLTDLYLTSNSSNTINLQQFNSLKNVVLEVCKNITSINLSSCQSLDSLYLSGIDTKELYLDISNCKNLRFHYLNVGNLTKLNASGSSIKDFIYQDISSMHNPLKWNLTSLNMSNCTSLISLLCNKNKIKEIDVSGCTSLTTLSCSENYVEDLKMSNNKALTTLYCDNNNLKKLDLSACPALTMLTCTNNNLENLNVSSCVVLNKLWCRNNQLKELDVHTCLVLKELSCINNNDLKTLILAKNHQIEWLFKDEHTEIVLK